MKISSVRNQVKERGEKWRLLEEVLVFLEKKGIFEARCDCRGLPTLTIKSHLTFGPQIVYFIDLRFDKSN